MLPIPTKHLRIWHAGIRFCGVLLLLLCAIPFASRADEFPIPPKPQGYVSDFANVLSADARDQLTTLCTEVDKKAQAQIAVVTVPSIGDKPIFDYTLDMAMKWGVGPKESKRGILILFAISDHKYWAQVGYGLEGILPDGKVGGFGRETVPYLKQDNYDAALLLMTRRVADVIAQDSGVTLSGQAPPAYSSGGSDSDDNFSTPVSIILVVAFVGMAWLIQKFGHGGGSGRSGWSGGSRGGWTGGGFGGGGWSGGGGGGGGGGFGGFGGGSFGGGGAGGSW